jgi:hypothetical protein
MAPRALILDLLAWIAAAPRSYGEVMEAWRTSCPRLTVWEDALDQGLVCRLRHAGEEPSVELTDAGRATLEAHAASAWSSTSTARRLS